MILVVIITGYWIFSRGTCGNRICSTLISFLPQIQSVLVLLAKSIVFTLERIVSFKFLQFLFETVIELRYLFLVVNLVFYKFLVHVLTVIMCVNILEINVWRTKFLSTLFGQFSKISVSIKLRRWLNITLLHIMELEIIEFFIQSLSLLRCSSSVPWQIDILSFSLVIFFLWKSECINI